MLGWAADGFPIYSRRDGPPGTCDGTFVQDYDFLEGLDELDAANSRFGATAEYPEGTIYYAFTHAFPYISRHYRGTPDPSFANPLGPSGNNPELRDYQG